jgi:hypothetical protein
MRHCDELLDQVRY